MPLAGSVESGPIKDLSDELSRSASIEALREISERVPVEPVEHAVYEGRKFVGRYSRISPKNYEAFNADGVSLGEFRGRRQAYGAIVRSADSGAR